MFEIRMRFGDIPKLWLIFAAIYFPMLTVLPLSIDAELLTIRPQPLLFIQQGRWTAYFLLYHLLPPFLVPYFTLAFCGLMTALAYRLLLDACETPLDWRACVAFAIFCGFPFWYLLLEFPTNIAPAGAGLALSAAAVWLLSLRNSGWAPRYVTLALEAFAIASALGAYQAFFLVYVAMVLAMTLLNKSLLTSGDKLLVLIQALSALALGCVVYFAIQQALLWYLGTSTVYIDGFFRPDLLIGDTFGVVDRTIAEIYRVYSGSSAVYGASMICIIVVMLMGFLATVIKRSALDTALYLCLLLVPFGLSIMSGGDGMPRRALVAVAVSLWAASMMGMSSSHTATRLVSIIAAVYMAVQSIGLISQYEAQRRFVSSADQITAGQIYQRISELSDLSQLQLVDIYGGLTAPSVYPVASGSTAGGSFFSWDNGNAYRMIAYMRLLGYRNIKVAHLERGGLIPLYANMPTWPAAGSVKKYQNIVLIKLGDTKGFYVQ